MNEKVSTAATTEQGICTSESTSQLLSLRFYRSWYLYSLILLITPHLTVAQDPIREANLELRHFFQYTYLATPSTSKDFLYDMSVKLTDSSYYRHISDDTIHTGGWLRLYEEMWWAAKDTTILEKADSVYADALGFSGDTIPIGIMAFDYWALKDDALTTNNYFDFDTVNDVIYDKPGRTSEPYVDSSLFSAVPLKNESFFRNPIFRIDPNFLFYDSDNQWIFNSASSQLQINFDDGLGWRLIDASIVNHFAVNYTSSGIKRIRVRVQADGTTTVKKSTSLLGVKHNYDRADPDEWIPAPGLTAGVYKGCASDPGQFTKPIIYIRGYDVMDNPYFSNTNIPEIYYDIGLDQNLADLRNYDYDLIIVEFDNITIDLRHNAAYLTWLVEHIKEYSDPEDQIVMVGHSTGSLIARTCLTYMESSYYQNNDLSPLTDTPEPLNFSLTNWNSPELMHKTRTYINFDGPMQGASIPMAYQTLYKRLLSNAGMLGALGVMARRLVYEGNLLLEATAARQMLIYHINTKSGGGTIKNYTHHWRRDDYLAYFEDPDINDYPIYCKNVAIANGSFNGVRQRNFYTNTERTPGDFFLNSSVDIYCRIFRKKYPLLKYKLKLRTNNSNKPFYKFEYGIYTRKYFIKLFKVEIRSTYKSRINDEEYGNLVPYCTDAGGFYGIENPENNSWMASSKYNNRNVFSVFEYSFSQSNGCSVFKNRTGWDGIFSGNTTVSACTDGIQFGFIPTYSAFDFAGSPRNPDISDKSLSDWFDDTPFDVLITNIDPDITENPNRFHRDFNNNPIELEEGPLYLEYCVFGEDQDTVRLINREIGDEVLYVDNFFLSRPATFSAIYQVNVNVFNPFYKYVSNFPGSSLVSGTYSRQNILDGGYDPSSGAAFQVNFLTSYNGVVEYNPDHVEIWDAQQGGVEACCIDYHQKSSVVRVREKPSEEDQVDKLTLYPNPVSDGEFTIKLFLGSHAPTSISVTIYDVMGKQCFEREYSGVFIDEANLDVRLSQGFAPGLYNIVIEAGKSQYGRKIIIQ